MSTASTPATAPAAAGGAMAGRSPAAALELGQLAPVLVLWLVLALLPVGRSAELPLLAGAIWGLVLLWRDRPGLLALPAARLGLALFACYWLPGLVSALDAVAPERTWSQVAAQLRFAPFVLFVAGTVRTPAQWQWLLRASALLLLVWLLDAWVQAFTGTSLGGPMDSDRLSGIFGADNLKLGGVVAALSPLLLAFAQQRLGLRGVFAAALLIGGVVLLAGARAAWVVYALVLAGWCLRPALAEGAGRVLALVAALAVAGAAIGYGAYQLSPRFAERLDRTAHLAGGSIGDLDHALAGRVPIWRTAAAMARAHPVNGVGVRGFRHAYADHAAADDPWLAHGGALHPHQLLLELASETGALGLAGLILATWLLARAAWRAPAAARLRAFAPLLALAAMLFPLNTHYALYSSWWSLFTWWLLALALAALHLREDRP
jgi:O-antigen ligase